MIQRFTSEEKHGDKTITHENFVLATPRTTYVMRTMETGQLEHIYYGARIHVDEKTNLAQSHTNAPGDTSFYNNEHPEFTLEDMCLETSAFGKGDIREPQISILAPDGSSTLDFVYDNAVVTEEKPAFSALPYSYADADSKVEHLCICMKDKNNGYLLELHYYVYEDCDTITRNARFLNLSDAPVTLTRALSMLMDFPSCGYRITTFRGGWTKEMGRYDTLLTSGKLVNASFTGTSSNRANPFVMLADPLTGEDQGAVYAFNMLYSGNHYECFDVNSFGKTRVAIGINPEHFSWLLPAGEVFEMPEVAFTFSKEGYNGMSQNMHHFVREHITRGPWKHQERPVLLNSWEANYFNIDESKLLRLAKKGKDVGIELFVMDDGWFGARTDDKRALGDWTVDCKKLPGGLKGLADKLHSLDLKFGIWIEPEMINTDSDLYRAHPDWAMDIPGKDHSEGRTQRMLDLANPEVVSYMVDAISAVLDSAQIDYVKWDMNRIVSDIYSRALPAERQGETLHRYVLGFYEMLRTLTSKYPEILWEGCASGGNRFDLGVLCYYSQIWGSDNTDAMSRTDIQNGYSYGYPQITYTSHVSSVPNHQTLRETPLSTRANVAFFGNLGYECNLCDMSDAELDAIRAQITLYKNYRQTLQFGSFYRTEAGLVTGGRSSNIGTALGLTSPGAGLGATQNVTVWTIVSEDQSTALAALVKKNIYPSDPHLTYVARGLAPEKKYLFSNLPEKVNVKSFGDLINTTGLPVHIKQDSLLHNVIAKFYQLDGEVECATLYGDALMECGNPLTQSYIGTGINEVRIFKDFDSRLYIMEEEQ